MHKYGKGRKESKRHQRTVERCNIIVIKVMEGDNRYNGVEVIFVEIMAEMFLKLVKRD